MPRQGSRAQLIHILAADEAITHAFYYGERLLPAAAFYETYQNYSTAALRELLAEYGLSPKTPGRPKRRARKSYDAELLAVVEAHRGRLSERSAIELVARARRVHPDALRMRFRRAKKAASELGSKK